MSDIWYMDSDLCENCGDVLGYFGECPNCGWEGIDWGEEEDEDDPYTDFGDYDEQAYLMGDYDEEEQA